MPTDARQTEDILRGHPAVLDPAVIGIPHEDFGEAVHAVVQLMPDHRSAQNPAGPLPRNTLGHEMPTQP